MRPRKHSPLNASRSVSARMQSEHAKRDMTRSPYRGVHFAARQCDLPRPIIRLAEFERQPIFSGAPDRDTLTLTR